MPDFTSGRTLSSASIALLLLWLGFLGWKNLNAPPVPDQNLAFSKSNKTNSPSISSQHPTAKLPLATRINLPVIGEIAGARWIAGQTFRNPDPLYADAYTVTADILVDEQGRFLAARAGDDSFATVPTPDRYHEVLGLLLETRVQYSEAPEELTERVLSVKIKPADLNSINLRKRIWRMTGNGGLFKYGLWYQAEVEFEGETAPRTVWIHTWNSGSISEKSRKLHQFFPDVEADYIPYDSPAIPGANRYGTNVGIHASQSDGKSGAVRYVTEPWAGFSPWKDEELDPKYGELLLNECSVPTDRTIDHRFFQDLSSRASHPDIPPEVKARLDREAAEKSASKNK